MNRYLSPHLILDDRSDALAVSAHSQSNKAQDKPHVRDQAVSVESGISELASWNHYDEEFTNDRSLLSQSPLDWREPLFLGLWRHPLPLEGNFWKPVPNYIAL